MQRSCFHLVSLCRDTVDTVWPTISKANLQYSILKPFWKLGMEGALALGAEAWSFEVTTILAGLLGTVALDAHIITLTFSSFIYLSFPFAFGIATSIRVGQLTAPPCVALIFPPPPLCASIYPTVAAFVPGTPMARYHKACFSPHTHNVSPCRAPNALFISLS